MPVTNHFKEPLTVRQLQLVAHAANGLTFEEIAEEEYLSPDTVRNTLVNARERTNARNTAHLTALVVGAGLLIYEDDSEDFVEK